MLMVDNEVEIIHLVTPLVFRSLVDPTSSHKPRGNALSNPNHADGGQRS